MTDSVRKPVLCSFPETPDAIKMVRPAWFEYRDAPITG
jgi:hypothetical protein